MPNTQNPDPDLEALENVTAETQARKKSAVARRRKPKQAVIPKDMKVGQFIQQETQKMLLAQDPKSPDPKTRLQTMLEAGYKRAIDMRSGQGKAITELLLAYAFEKPKPAENELEAIAKSGFQVVYVERGGLENVQKMDKLPEPKPEFLESEVVEDEI